MKNKFPLLFSLLFFALPCFVFADLHFRFYPGLYLGADWERPADNGLITIGADIQMGLEIGDFDYDDFIFGIFGNVGLDTGQPNEPNIYYGGMAEFYFWGYEIKLGAALGFGGNGGIAGLETNGPVRDSGYIRVGIPVNFFGRMKCGFYCDYYFDVGSRLGMIFHF